MIAAAVLRRYNVTVLQDLSIILPEHRPYIFSYRSGPEL